MNTNDLAGELGEAVASSRHYYLVGFTPRSGGDGTYHRINVRLWDSKWKVVARSGFMDFSAKQTDERQILGSFVLPEMFTELPLELELMPLERRGKKWLAEAQIRIPVTAMDRLPRGPGSYGQIEVGATLFRGSALAFQFERALTVQFPDTRSYTRAVALRVKDGIAEILPEEVLDRMKQKLTLRIIKPATGAKYLLEWDW